MENINGYGVGIKTAINLDDLNSMDIGTLIMVVLADRSRILENQLKDQLKEMGATNKDIETFTNLMSVLREEMEGIPTDTDATKDANQIINLTDKAKQAIASAGFYLNIKELYPSVETDMLTTTDGKPFFGSSSDSTKVTGSVSAGNYIQQPPIIKNGNPPGMLMSSIQNIGFSNGWNEIEKGIVLGTKTAVDLKNYVKNFTGFYGEKLGMPTALANVDTDPKAAKAVEDWVKYRQAVATGTISKDNTFQTSYSKKTLKARIDTIKSRLDTMSNTQSQSQIRMQSVNGKYSEANELLSNLLKKMFDNGDGIISNMR